ncbi:nuclear transport factor 2 family protein [Dietzia aurantiaca]|uniref:Nuclear transport factor 2 family protein n=1 Tax=Dietzia aurantiaca TaxID=983873 RepID=A0ABV9PVC5_9ACTN
MSDQLRETNQQIVRGYIDGINAWDFDGMREIMAPDFVFEQMFAPPGMQKRYEGRDTLLEFQQSLTSLIITENLHDLELDTLASDPGVVIATYRSDMELSDPDKSYTNDYICRFVVRDGLITHFQEYFDGCRLVTSFGGTVTEPQIG